MGERVDLASSSIEFGDDRNTLGVINALERTCELEAKLRSAIQQTHPLTTTLDWDFTAADKEREALLAISEQLEYLEDKLREARFLGKSGEEQRGVVLSQLEGVRRELLGVVEAHAPRIVFAKDVVRELLAFASTGDDALHQGAQLGVGEGRAGGHGASRLSAAGASATLVGMVASPKPRQASPRGAGSPGASLAFSPHRHPATDHDASRASSPYVRPYDNRLWEPDGPAPPTSTTHAASRRHAAAREESAAFTSASPASSRGAADRRGLLGGGAARRYGASAYAPRIQISDEDIYGPQPAARGVQHGPAHRPAAAAAAAAAAAPPADSPRRFGGVLKIKDMLARAEQGLSKVAEAQEQRRLPTPPRIFSDGGSEMAATEAWAAGLGPVAAPSLRGGEEADDVVSLWGGVSQADHAALSVRDWQLRAEASHRSRLAGAAPAHATPQDSSTMGTPRPEPGGALPGVVGKLAGLVFLLGSVAAAAMAAGGKLGGGRHRKGAQTWREAGGDAPSSRGRTDLPPWSAAEAKAARRRGSSPTSTAASRARRRQGGAEVAAQAPVMHVHQPPSSAFFPADPPPDVTVAMG